MRIGEIAVACAFAVAVPGTAHELTTPELCDRLARSDTATDPAQMVSALDALRARGRAASAAAETLSGLLPHRSRIFSGRDKDLVVRLRAYIMVTLSEVGVPDSARAALLDVLAHVDERNNPAEVGAAARAVASLGRSGASFTPYLLGALTARLSVEEFSLQRFDVRFPASESTSAQLELVRALDRVSSPGDLDLREVLAQLINDHDRDPRVVRAARRVLARPPDVPSYSVRPSLAIAAVWPSAEQRVRVQPLDISYTDHDGRDGVLRNLVDRPVLITFFYSRCQNSKKCSLAVARMGALQRRLALMGIAERVRLLAISYEPQFDTPERIHRFATDRGLRLGANALALQLDVGREHELTDALEAPVNYNSDWVNTHGVELSLLDGAGRVVRQYQTILWDNDQVLADVTRLLGE